MKYDQDLCLNFDLKKLLWQDELNPRVRCVFGNDYMISGDTIFDIVISAVPKNLAVQLYTPLLQVF